MKKGSKAAFALVVVITLIASWWAFSGQISDSRYFLGSVRDMRFGIDIRGGVNATFVPKDLNRAPTPEELEAARSVIETRLDQNNILDRDVTLDPANGTILVQFPWKSDETDFQPDKAIQELGSMARLTFRGPDGTIILEGAQVESADPAASLNEGPYIINLSINSEGRAAFAEATEQLVGQSLSIYMDETMIVSPIVQGKIDSDQFSITRIQTEEEARLLSNQINSGSLPFSLVAENYSAISPQLGTNALEVMIQAGLAAFLIICLALMLIYRASGIVASISLLLQVAGILLMFSLSQLTVTLPGIAGIILSIGMGVDANIISAERIRDEFRAGKSMDESVQSGFRMAFSSIFDGNITVLIVAGIMMLLGSGAVLSFAYSLLFGIIMNFVAGVVATRLMTLSLIRFPFMRKPQMFLSDTLRARAESLILPFFGKRKALFSLSGAFLLVGLVLTFAMGPILDIQFQGGTILKYDMSESVELSPQDVDGVASSVLSGHVVSAQITEDFASGDKRLVLSMAGGDSLDSEELETLTAALVEAFPDQAFAVADTYSVTSSFGRRYLERAGWALGLSALLIILYVWFSFRKIHGLSAGVMALLALLHDVLMVFFTFVVLRIPISESSFVAAALTILGYSINGTIVVYDRIRENTKLNPGMPVETMVEKSISQTLTRSVYTSVAVFVSVLLVYVFARANGLDTVSAFALPMAVGTVFGCYSSVCIAGPLWTLWQKRKHPAKADA